MLFPDYRPRRLRQNEAFRRMIRETVLSVDDLILPLFAIDGKKVKNPIASMPGQYQLSVDHLVQTAREAHELGIPGRHALRRPGQKRPPGNGRLREGRHRSAGRPGGQGCVPDLAVITDVCLCAVHRPRALRRAWRTSASTTMPPWICWRAPPCPTPRPARTWWRLRT